MPDLNQLKSEFLKMQMHIEGSTNTNLKKFAPEIIELSKKLGENINTLSETNKVLLLESTKDLFLRMSLLKPEQLSAGDKALIVKSFSQVCDALSSAIEPYCKKNHDLKESMRKLREGINTYAEEPPQVPQLKR